MTLPLWSTPFADFSGVGSKIPAAWPNQVRLALPNAIDGAGGGTYSPTSAVVVNGAFGFQISTLNIQSGGTETIQSGGFLTFAGGSIGSIAANAIVNIQNLGLMNVLNGGKIDVQTGANLWVEGLLSIRVGGVLGVNGNVAFSGSGQALWQSGSTGEFQSGSTAHIDSGATLQVDAGANFPVSAALDLTGTAAVTRKRLGAVGDNNVAITMGDHDVVYNSVPVATSNRTWTVSAPVGNRPCSEIFRFYAAGNPSSPNTYAPTSFGSSASSKDIFINAGSIFLTLGHTTGYVIEVELVYDGTDFCGRPDHGEQLTVVSPIFRINGGSPGAKAALTANAAFTASLDSLDGVSFVEWEISSTDELSSPSDYTLVESNLFNSTVSSTALSAGTAAILRCTINHGRDLATGNASPTTTTATAKIYVPTSQGFEVGAAGEQFESDPTFGSTGITNNVVREVDTFAGSSAATGAHPPVKAATTANITLSGTQAIDGVSCGVGDRVLVIAQTLGQNNGIYLVASGAWTRAADANTSGLVITGMTVAVQLGLVYGHTSFRLVTKAPITLGTTPLLFQLVATSPRMVAARDFAVSFPGSFGALQGLTPYPIKLSDLYANVAAAQADFPLLDPTNDLASAQFSRGNTYDWAVVLSAIRYAEAHGNATVWLDHASYGITGEFVVHGGVVIKGQGSQGSNNALGTSLVIFDTGDLFYFKGDADPFSTGGFSGTGGGLENILISKAERSTFGGASYAGGCALRLAAQSTAKRPGFFWIKNVDVEAESYTPASGWDDCWIVDGINAYDPFNLGVRTIQGHRCRFASCIHDSRTVTWRYVEHVAITGLQIEQGVAPHPAALRVQGDCNNVQLDAAVINGSLIIEDSTPGSTTTVVPVAISNITKASPAVVTAAHGFSLGTGNTYAHVRILGITTPQHALGAFNAKVIDANTLWLYDANLNPVDTTGDSAYTSGGTLRSTSPRHVNIQGHVEELDCTAYDAYGLLPISNGTEVTFTSPTSNVPTVSPIINSSPNLRIIAANGPSIQLELFNTIDASETGDNTVFTVTFNQLNFDRNNEGPNGLSGRYLAYIPNCAGTFRLQARVCLRDNTGTASAAPWWPTNTRAIVSLEVTRLAGGVATYSKFVALNSLSQLITLDIEQTVVLQQGDAVRVKVQVFGTAGKNVDVFSDSGSGLTMFTAELL